MQSLTGLLRLVTVAKLGLDHCCIWEWFSYTNIGSGRSFANNLPSSTLNRWWSAATGFPHCPLGAFKCSVPLFCPFLTCLCSCLLGPPASQGAPLLECRCCHCHTCTTHRPSFLPLHSVSPGVQVLRFPFLYSTLNHHTSAYTPHHTPPSLLFLVVGVPQCTFSLYFVLLIFQP